MIERKGDSKTFVRHYFYYSFCDLFPFNLPAVL